MSYNIDNVRTLVLDAWMRAEDVLSLAEECDQPERCFLNEMRKAAEDACTKGDRDARIILPNFWWYGECSGRTHSDLIEVVAPKIHGVVEAVFYWEGGDSVTGLVIKDGKVAECGVIQTLDKPKDW